MEGNDAVHLLFKTDCSIIHLWSTDNLQAQQTLSMGPINISLRTLTISCDYLRCRVITIRLHWINSDIKQICPLRFVSMRQKLATLRVIVNYEILNGLLVIVSGSNTFIRFI